MIARGLVLVEVIINKEPLQLDTPIDNFHHVLGSRGRLVGIILRYLTTQYNATFSGDIVDNSLQNVTTYVVKKLSTPSGQSSDNRWLTFSAL